MAAEPSSYPAWLDETRLDLMAQGQADCESEVSGFILQAAQVFFMLFAFLAAAFVFDLLARQNRGALARSELLFFNRDLGFLLRHAG